MTSKPLSHLPGPGDDPVGLARRGSLTVPKGLAHPRPGAAAATPS